jgi:peptide-methionine (R)-S-oxide reductase
MKFKAYLFLLVAFTLVSCKTNSQSTTSDENVTATATPSNITKVVKTKKEWKEILNKQEYYVLREKGTERSFTGEYWDHKEEGVYTCRGCDLPLFDSKTKFKSGTGWPSYYEPIEKDHITEDTDYILGYPRTEITCTRCGGHLGHVFNDGPAPTGLRYCINSVSLGFESN